MEMRAFTLIEVIISTMLLSIILLGGTAVFYQRLKSSGISDVNSNLNSTLQSILNAIKKDVKYAQILGVGDGTRTDCLLAGVNGYSGSSLLINDLNGHGTRYSLNSELIASTSAETNQTTYLNTSQIAVQSLQFTWYCLGSDKIKIALSAKSNALGTGIQVDQDVSIEISLFNSGQN